MDAGPNMEPLNTVLRISGARSVTTRIAAFCMRQAKRARTPIYKMNRSPAKSSQNLLEVSQYQADPLPSCNPPRPPNRWRGSQAVTPQIAGKVVTSTHLHYPLQQAGAMPTLFRQLQSHVAPVKLPDRRHKPRWPCLLSSSRMKSNRRK
jgi:hypothetical protein